MDWDQRYQTIFYLKPWDPGEEPDGGPPFGVSTAELDQLFDPVFDRLPGIHPRQFLPGPGRPGDFTAPAQEVSIWVASAIQECDVRTPQRGIRYGLHRKTQDT